MPTRTRNSKLEDALAQLVQSQAQLVLQNALFVSHLDEDRRRFSRIEQELFEMKTLLLQHAHVLKNLVEMLNNLPEAIRQKIGFQRK